MPAPLVNLQARFGVVLDGRGDYIVHRANLYPELVAALYAIAAADDIKSLADIVEAMPAVRAVLAKAEAL